MSAVKYTTVTREELERLIIGKKSNEIVYKVELKGNTIVLPVELAILYSKKVRHTSVEQLGIADANKNVPQYEIWRIHRIVAMLQAGVGVANRVLTVEISPGVDSDRLGAALDFLWNSNAPAGDSLTISASELGIIWYELPMGTVGGFGIKSDNGTVTALTNLPGQLHIRGMPAGSNIAGQITAHITNQQVTDWIVLDILYELVGSEES